MLTNEMSDLSYTFRPHCIAIDTRFAKASADWWELRVTIRLPYQAVAALGLPYK